MNDTDSTAYKFTDTQTLSEVLKEFTLRGLGYCRSARAIRHEIQRRISSESAARTRLPNSSGQTESGPASFAIRSGESVRIIKELIQRHWHLDSVGLGNCRAAQEVLRELNEQLLIQSAALANANFDPNEARNRHGQWTTNATSTATNRTSQTSPTHRADHIGAAKDATTRPKTAGTAGGTKPPVPAVPPPEKIALSTNEPALMIERVLLSETKGVEQSGFNKAEALKNMKAIGALIYNRAHANELGFSSFHYPTNLLNIVTQTNQFRGFEHYNPVDATGDLSSNRLRNIDICVQGANDPKDKKHYQNYVDVVKQAKAIAQDIIKGSVDDPFSPWFTFSVKTAGPSHAGPGGSFQYLGTAAGNNFYGFPPPKAKNNQIHP